MKSINNFLKIAVFLLFCSSVLTANYKIILGSYDDQQTAKSALENIISEVKLNKYITELQAKHNFNFTTSKSKQYHTLIADNLQDKTVTLNLLQEIKKDYPTAFLVKVFQKTQENRVEETKKILNKRNKVNVNFSNLQINDFIKLISKITNKNILINNKISGTVDFVSTTPVYDDELVGILVSVLESKGFTLIKNGSLYEIVRSIEATKYNAVVASPGKKLYGSLMVTQAIEIKDENVDIIAAKIRHLMSKSAKLITMKESNTLLITDYPKNIETIKSVIKDIETNNEAIVKIVDIKNTEAKKLQKRLVDISKSIFNEKIAAQAVKIIHDDNINGIILVGNKGNVKKLEELIEKLDVESNVGKTVNVFPLNNSDSKAVLKTLNEIVSKQTFIDPALKPNITASEEINSIIAVGDPTVIKGIKLIIDELDKEKYQVYVQAKIVNINKSNAEDIGVKYGFATGDISSAGLYAMSANFGASALTEAAAKTVTDYLGAITLASKDNFALGATIDFLQTKGASTTISNPSILCVNNKESSIYVGKTISVSSGTTTGASTSTSYKREDVGLTLKIKPRVSSNDKVTLDIETVLENVLDDGSNNETGQPITSKQEVKTQAILRHGESIIIGGLVTNDKQKSKTQLPLLGDIPVVGDMVFSSNSESDAQDSIIVILTPYVIDDSEKLSELQSKLGKLSNMQRLYDKEVFKAIEERKGQE